MDVVMADEKPKDSKELLAKAMTAFERCQEAESENRDCALDDIRFSRLGEQWPDTIIKQRQLEQRPCLTINKMPAFIRQVVNDARQNKPSIKVHPVDSGADVETADVMNGLIKNIEYTSNADVAYDTAIEASVSGGFGYWRVGLDYAYDDTFDMDLSIDRVANQFSVYGDPDDMGADSSGWNVAFVVEPLRKAEYLAKYKGKKNTDGNEVCVDFESDAWSNAGVWRDGDTVMLAEWWRREEVEREIVKCSNGYVYDKEEFDADPDLQTAVEMGGLKVVGTRTTKSHKVTQTILSGADVLAVNPWPGKYIPIIPVYGDEIVIEGKRYFRSLIHDAKDAQRMTNYWRTTGTELVALAPRVPWIGRKGTFNSDADRWATANTTSHSYLEYDTDAPTRLPLDTGVAAGAMQEALNASDDQKAIMGLYDASLGARSNETSGIAINARKREGDVATFHFIDNLSRAIRHTGRILIDLIPKVYTEERIIRIIGDDGTQETKTINGPAPKLDKKGNPVVDEAGNPIMAMHDLTTGKYDLTVTTGPSYTTKREEAAASMTELIRAFPMAAPVVGPMLAKALDWPGADDVAEKLEEMTSGQVPPQLQKQIDEGKQQLEQLTKENQQLKMNQQAEQAKMQSQNEQAKAKMASDEQLAALNIQSQERIAQMKIESEAKIAVIKTHMTSSAGSEQKAPSESISFKDLPPDGQAQMAAQAGIFLSPQQITDHTAQQAAEAAKSRSNPA
jgi:hypothetical protein